MFRLLFISQLVMALIFAVINNFAHSYVLCLFLKTVCSGIFVFTSFYAYKSLKVSYWSKYCKIILLGQIMCFVGDFLLQLGSVRSVSFVFGLLSFISAHFVFIVALTIKTRVEAVNIIIPCVLEAVFITGALTLPIFDFYNALPIIDFYVVMDLYFLGKSLSYARFRKSYPKFSLYTILGVSLIIAADTVILFVLFVPSCPTKVLSLVNLLLYYAGQETLALSLSCPEAAA